MWPALHKLHELHNIMYGKCPTYKPVSGDMLPSYFYSMLDDIDRTLKYSEAINLCLQELSKHVQNIIVVDVGCGTGLLSALCLHHGANLDGVNVNVVGVDVNAAALRSAKNAMHNLGYNDFFDLSVTASMQTDKILQKVQQKLGTSDTQPFHMIVSEILGTFVFGESMETYIKKYLPLLKRFGGNRQLFSVPKSCTQTVAFYAFNTPIHVKNTIEHVCDLACSEQLYLPTDKGSIGIPLHLFSSTVISPPQIVYHADYSELITSSSSRGDNAKESIKINMYNINLELKDLDSNSLNLGVFEWTCELWTGVTLSNTIQEYRELSQQYGPRFALGRMNAWGFMIFSVHDVQNISVKYDKTNCIVVKMNQFILDDVSIGEYQWVSSCTDFNLIDSIANALNVPDVPTTTILVIDDITCGGLCLKLLNKFNNVQIVVKHKHMSAAAHKTLEMIKNPRITVTPITTGRKRNREPDTLTPTCIVFPNLYHMHQDYTSVKQVYNDIVEHYGCLAFPNLNMINNSNENITRNVSSGTPTTQSVKHILDQVGAIRQMITHPESYFTTREFLAPPFWYANDGDIEVNMNIHHVVDHANGPASNLGNIETLIQNGDILSAISRMFGAYGIVCRIRTPDDGLDGNPEIDEVSDVSEDDDSDYSD